MSKLDARTRRRLVEALRRETGWDVQDRLNLLGSMAILPDGDLDVREDYQSEVEQKSWTNAEKVDAALDYWGID